MREISVMVYEFEELPEDVQDKVLDGFRDGDLYVWENENLETLKAFENIFPVKVKSWEYGGRNYINFNMERFDYDEEILEFTGVRLLKWIVNNYWDYLWKGKFICGDKYPKKRYSKVMFDNCCVLTGYCMDNDILAPVYEFLKKPGDGVTLEGLMNDCLHEWVFACNRDTEYAYSDEGIKETVGINEYEFTVDGKVCSQAI